MKITFDWKNFEHIKPDINKLIVIKGIRTISTKKSIVTIGKYKGVDEDVIGSIKQDIHIISNCKEFDFERFIFVNKNYHIPLYQKEHYINNFNPYDFDWDYWFFNIL